MLFNSFPFIFAFLPVALVGFFVLARVSERFAAGWLTVASLSFYGWWDVRYVPLLLASICFNFVLGNQIARQRESRGPRASKRLLFAAIAVNLTLLAYFKYTVFFLSNLQVLTGRFGAVPAIVLPLGISFFTFTQIAFLVDVHRGIAREYRFMHYALFVSYFPHLIAGPILHHREMMPQFQQRATYKLNWDSIAVGLTMFVIGLFKKTVIADDMASFVTPAFSFVAAGRSLTLLEAWGAALAYTFQIYFDFSGYTDMALGASRMFGIVLPLNFNSPYKARSVIDFWRRWHITLSRFLRDYVYIALGGNRKTSSRRYVNIMATMLIGGLWHGAAWTFVVWGGLHGVYLLVNHGWRALRKYINVGSLPGGSMLATVITFVAVVVAWVFFRAPDLATAASILASMVGQHGVVLPSEWQPSANVVSTWLGNHGVHFGALAHFNRIAQLNWLCILLAFCWVAPNTQQILALYHPALLTPGYGDPGNAGVLTWRPSPFWLAASVALALFALLSVHRYSEFIYFRF
ncbi:MAG TPA: MBOAT family O-acyltransferase [Casimicrobiaceae bacterium]|nr:MBOAT family O-acyltransferase [Casimicrobiaceae bacterium]